MFETCHIHIGTEKTGTKSIQEFMQRNADRLNERGILYPASLGPLNHRKLRNFAASTHEHLMGAEVRQHPGGVEGFRSQLVHAFQQEIENTACCTLVVSDEHFHSALTTPEEVQRLRSFLEPCSRRFQVIVYLRRQDELCRSFFSEYIKTGRRGIQPLLGDSIEYYYDYRALIENYECVFGRGNVLVRRHETGRLVNGDVIDDFAALVGLGDVRTWQRPGRRNVSLDGLALRFLIEFNRHVLQSIDGRLNPDRADLRAALEAHFAGQGWPVSRQWAVEFLQRYREINEWVRQRFFPDSPSLFDEDFSRYPVSVPAEPPEFNDAVAVAAVLWRHQTRAVRTLRAEVATLQAHVAFQDGRIALLEGDTACAIQALRNALSLDPDHDPARQLLRQALDRGVADAASTPSGQLSEPT